MIPVVHLIEEKGLTKLKYQIMPVRRINEDMGPSYWPANLCKAKGVFIST